MSDKLELTAIPHFPLIEPGDHIADEIFLALQRSNIQLIDGDCLVVAQKIISKAENRYAFLNEIVPSDKAKEWATKTDKDPHLIELILRESKEVLRFRKGVMIVEHRLGYVHANAGIDQSNIEIDSQNPRVLLLPVYPDKSALAIQQQLREKTGASVKVIVSDSAGRAWRNGIIGFALGTAGFEVVIDKVGEHDLFGSPLRVTQIAIADEIAAAASLLMGQASEGKPVVIVRGLDLKQSTQGSEALIRNRSEDLFR